MALSGVKLYGYPDPQYPCTHADGLCKLRIYPDDGFQCDPLPSVKHCAFRLLRDEERTIIPHTGEIIEEKRLV